MQPYYDIIQNKVRFLLSIDFENEIENVLKLHSTNEIAKLLEKETHDLKFHTFILKYFLFYNYLQKY